MGTAREDYVKLSQRIGGTTGGIVPATFTSAIRDSNQSAAWLFLRSKAIPSQTGDLLALLRDVLLTARLDNRERFRQIILEEKASLEAQLTPAGHRVVNTRLRSQFGEAGWAVEQMSGVSYLFFLRRLAEAVEQDWPSALNSLEGIRGALLKRGAAVANVTLDATNWSQFRPELAAFLGDLPEGATVQERWKPELSAFDQGLTIPAKVNFVGKGADLFDLGYQLSGSYIVINNYLNTSWLYERIRLQGGAYGVFSVFDHRSGVYTFLSYHDPNLQRTLATYDQTGSFLRQLEPSRLGREEITKSIIGAIGDLDAYQLPDARGYTSMQRYLAGDTDESRQRLRDQVLETSLGDFHAFGEVLEQVAEAGRVVVLGSKDAIESANASRDGWLDLQKVM
jgi:Zn-dependent M16 (insulinase) family peptidase